MSGNIQNIKAQEAAIKARARENALQQRQLAEKRLVRDVVTDQATGASYVKRPYTLTSDEFDLNQNVVTVLSEIARLADPGVPLGLEFMFVPTEAGKYGQEYLTPRAYGLIHDGTNDINNGRLVVVVESPQGIEKAGGRLLDISPQKMNEATAADRNVMLMYQVSESLRASQGDRIVWRLNHPTAQVSWDHSYFTMEVVALELIK